MYLMILTKIYLGMKIFIFNLFLNLIYLIISIFQFLNSIIQDDIYASIKILRESLSADILIEANRYIESREKWQRIYDKSKASNKVIHNISYNYWIRTYSARKFQDNLLKKFNFSTVRNLLTCVYFLFIHNQFS